MSNRVGLRQLRAFHAVMISGSLSAAAERLNLSLPAVSKQLSFLEHELDIRLFVRKSGKTIQPTSAGIEFFKAIEPMVSGLADLGPIAREIVEMGRRRLRIAATPPLLNNQAFMAAIQQFLDEYEDVKLTLDSKTRIDIEEWVAMRHIEFALALLPTSNPNLRTIPIVEAKAVAAVPIGHPLAKYGTLNPDLVRGHRMILPSRQLLRSRIDSALESSGHQFSTSIECSAGITCVRMASHGLGITISDPFSPSAMETKSLKICAWEPAISLTYGILMPAEIQLDAPAKAMIEILRSHLGQAELQ